MVRVCVFFLGSKLSVFPFVKRGENHGDETFFLFVCLFSKLACSPLSVSNSFFNIQNNN